MESTIESSYSIKDVIDAIYSKINHEPEAQELKIYLNNPKFITYLVHNKKTSVDEKIRYYDPLYSNSYIRGQDAKSAIELKFKLGLCEELSRVDQKVIIKKSGYAKFNIVNMGTYYQWRECRIKEMNKYPNVKFRSFNNPCKIFFNYSR